MLHNPNRVTSYEIYISISILFLDKWEVGNMVLPHIPLSILALKSGWINRVLFVKVAGCKAYSSVDTQRGAGQAESTLQGTKVESWSSVAAVCTVYDMVYQTAMPQCKCMAYWILYTRHWPGEDCGSTLVVLTSNSIKFRKSKFYQWDVLQLCSSRLIAHLHFFHYP